MGCGNISVFFKPYTGFTLCFDVPVRFALEYIMTAFVSDFYIETERERYGVVRESC